MVWRNIKGNYAEAMKLDSHWLHKGMRVRNITLVLCMNCEKALDGVKEN